MKYWGSSVVEFGVASLGWNGSEGQVADMLCFACGSRFLSLLTLGYYDDGDIDELSQAIGVIGNTETMSLVWQDSSGESSISVDRLENVGDGYDFCMQFYIYSTKF